MRDAGNRADKLLMDAVDRNGAVIVLKAARSRAGDPAFLGSAAECVRMAALALDEAPKAAAMLLASVRPPERVLQRLDSEERPLARATIRRRMIADFDAAIAKLYDTVVSRRRQRGVATIRQARNWANLKPKAEQAAEITRIFETVHEDVKKEIPDHSSIYVPAPRPVAPKIISTGSGSRGTADT